MFTHSLLFFCFLSVSPLYAADEIEDTDYQLAVKLSLEEADRQLALHLENEDLLEEGEQTSPHLSCQIRFDAELATKFDSLTIEQEQVYGEVQKSLIPLIAIVLKTHDQNVHTFNKMMQWKINYINLCKLHDKITTSYPIYTPGQIFGMIKETQFFHDFPTPNKLEFAKNEKKLLEYISKSPFEPETTASVNHLLARIWSLSCDRHDEHWRLFNLLVPIMVDNTTTGGGCYAGFAGRLCFVYLTLLNEHTKLEDL